MSTTKSRMKNVALLVPDAAKALQALKASAEKAGVPSQTLALVELRASQINGCSVCVDIHSRDLKHQGESDERIFTVAAWREAPYFSDAERAALALAEAVTRLSDREDPVPDAVWNEAARHYDERALASLLIVIGNINVWNRLNAATRQVGGAWTANVLTKA
jgi:AhpD family alkylhydroperoxidase